jgi:hypothetical protein
MPRKARLTLAARRDSADQNSLTDLITLDILPQLINDPNCFMADDQARLHWIFALNDMDVSAADGGEPHTNDGLFGSGPGDWFEFDSKIARALKDVRFHQTKIDLFRFSF